MQPRLQARGLTKQAPLDSPLNALVHLSSAMALLFTHGTQPGASADAGGEAGPSTFLGLWYLFCNLRRAAKFLKTAASSRRCAERRGPVCTGSRKALQRDVGTAFRASDGTGAAVCCHFNLLTILD